MTRIRATHFYERPLKEGFYWLIAGGAPEIDPNQFREMQRQLLQAMVPGAIQALETLKHLQALGPSLIRPYSGTIPLTYKAETSNPDCPVVFAIDGAVSDGIECGHWVPSLNMLEDSEDPAWILLQAHLREIAVHAERRHKTFTMLRRLVPRAQSLENLHATWPELLPALRLPAKKVSPDLVAEIDYVIRQDLSATKRIYLTHEEREWMEDGNAALMTMMVLGGPPATPYPGYRLQFSMRGEWEPKPVEVPEAETEQQE